jgi:hypothetical protein
MQMLFDSCIDPSEFRSAQAAVLLSHWNLDTRSGPRRMETVWLCIAIQYSRTIGAHRYEENSDTKLDEMAETPSKNSLKRLWWCCIIQDRSISLHFRRSVQIDQRDFDFSRRTVLGHADLSDEIDHSEVYSSIVKCHSITTLELHLRLWQSAISLLPLFFSSYDHGRRNQDSHHTTAELEEYDGFLQQWAAEASEGGEHQPSHVERSDSADHDIMSTFYDQAWLHYQ